MLLNLQKYLALGNNLTTFLRYARNNRYKLDKNFSSNYSHFLTLKTREKLLSLGSENPSMSGVMRPPPEIFSAALKVSVPWPARTSAISAMSITLATEKWVAVKFLNAKCHLEALIIYI